MLLIPAPLKEKVGVEARLGEISFEYVSSWGMTGTDHTVNRFYTAIHRKVQLGKLESEPVAMAPWWYPPVLCF